MLVWFSFTSCPAHTDTPLLLALGHALSTSAVEAEAAAAGVAAAATPFPLPLLAWDKGKPTAHGVHVSVSSPRPSLHPLQILSHTIFEQYKLSCARLTSHGFLRIFFFSKQEAGNGGEEAAEEGVQQHII